GVEAGADFGESVARLGEIDASGDHDLRLGAELGARERELAAERVVVVEGVAPGEPRDVEEMDQHRRAGQVAKKAGAESVALVRARDQARYVGQDEARLV